jgi:hypothetical protein
MAWNVYPFLLMCSTQNEQTSTVIDMIGTFPTGLRETLNINNQY